MEQLKLKIEQLVKQYKELFADEYEACKLQVKRNRENQINDTGDMSKHTDFINRPLLEYPETLEAMFQLKFNEDERNIFYNPLNNKVKKLNSSIEIHRWFAKKYPEFSLVKKI